MYRNDRKPGIDRGVLIAGQNSIEFPDVTTSDSIEFISGMKGNRWSLVHTTEHQTDSTKNTYPKHMSRSL